MNPIVGKRLSPDTLVTVLSVWIELLEYNGAVTVNDRDKMERLIRENA